MEQCIFGRLHCLNIMKITYAVENFPLMTKHVALDLNTGTPFVIACLIWNCIVQDV